MRVAILTISDSVARAEREDLSGPALVSSLSRTRLGGRIPRCGAPTILNRSAIRFATMSTPAIRICILTTGGTGLGPRDNTPEATLDVADRAIPGIAEEIRRAGAEKTPTALLSRGVAVIRNKTSSSIYPAAPKAPSNPSTPSRICSLTR